MKTNFLSIVAIIVGVVALLVSFGKDSQGLRNNDGSTLERIQKSKVMRIGYEGYPPYSIKDPSSGKLSGYSVDMAEYIAKQAGWKIEWVQTNADTKIPDLIVGRFDLMVEPIFRTIPRSTQVTFTRPYAYFGYAEGVVRKGDTRFTKIEDLNRPNITIAVRLGYTDQTFAEENLSRAKIKAMNVSDTNALFLDVISGNSDIALADAESVKAFAKEHSNQIDTLFINPPPASVPAGFMLKQGDFTFYNFLNTAIDYMETNKVLDSLDKKYNITVPQIPQQ